MWPRGEIFIVPFKQSWRHPRFVCKSDECLGEIYIKELVKKNQNHSFVSFVSRELKLNMPHFWSEDLIHWCKLSVLQKQVKRPLPKISEFECFTCLIITAVCRLWAIPQNVSQMTLIFFLCLFCFFIPSVLNINWKLWCYWYRIQPMMPTLALGVFSFF